MKVANRRDANSGQPGHPSVIATLDCHVTLGHNCVMQMSEIMLLVEAHKRARSGEAKKIRQQAGLTMAQVAVVVGVDVSSVSKWESGSRKPRGEHAVKWAALLNELEQNVEPAKAAA